MKCLICQTEKDKLSIHILQIHKIKPKDYYDKYFKKSNEGICLYCNKKTTYISLEKGYRKTCKKHSFKLVNDNLNVVNVSQLKSIKEKKKITCLKKYGYEYFFQCSDFKEKTKKVLISTYGVDNASKSKEIVNKIRTAFKNKYGCEHALQLPEFQKKFKETCLIHFGAVNPMLIESIRRKSTETLNKHYNCYYPLQSEKIRHKFRETCLKKYGVDNPFNKKDFLDKNIMTCRRKYGVDHYSKTFKFRLDSRNRLIERIKRQTNGKIKPQLGDNEEEFFNQLQKHISYKLILNQYFHAYYPDARIEEIKTIIEFDEPESHSGRKAIQRDLQKDEDYKFLGYKCIRVLEEDWKNNPYDTIQKIKECIRI